MYLLLECLVDATSQCQRKADLPTDDRRGDCPYLAEGGVLVEKPYHIYSGGQVTTYLLDMAVPCESVSELDTKQSQLAHRVYGVSISSDGHGPWDGGRSSMYQQLGLLAVGLQPVCRQVIR